MNTSKEPAAVVHRAGRDIALHATTVRQLGLDESYLEQRIGAAPELLGLSSLRAGIFGPYHVASQRTLTTPTGRTVYPDLLLVTRSAHLVVVEVKLADNPELLDRSVIAQVLDYASSIAVLDEDGLAEVLGDGGADRTLADHAAEWFPGLDDADEFAEVFAQRCARGEIELVVACDRAPVGLDDVGASLHRLSALAFGLRVIELVPHVGEALDGTVLFLRHERMRTQIVARTLVQVSVEGGSDRASVTVSTTAPDEVADAVERTQGDARDRQYWSREEIAGFVERTDFDRAEQDLVLGLLAFASDVAFGDRITSKPTVHPTFSLFVDGARHLGRGRRGPIMWSVGVRPGRIQYVEVFTAALTRHFGEEQVQRLVKEIEAAVEAPLRRNTDYAVVPAERLRERLPGFLEVSRRYLERFQQLAAGSR